MGDASQHQSSLRRKKLMDHLNPQLKGLMKDKDFMTAQPFLFGEDFGLVAKEKLEAAAALKKAVYPQPSSSKGKHNFQGGYPASSAGAMGAAINQTTPLGNPRREAAQRQGNLEID